MGRRATLFLTLFVLTATAWAQQKKRVAVLNFDYSTVSNSVTSIFGSNVDVGKGIADLLVEELVKGGVYSVIERKELDKILAEQNFSNSDRADQASAAKLARVLGVDSIIIGSITQFGRDDTSTKSNIPGLGRIGIGGVSKREAKAAVAITARIVSTDTAEILAVATGKGASVKSGTSLIGSSSGSAVDMTSSNFAGTIL
jgi:curli biogenesis system outer membrane secretion channel CsgG